MRVSPVKPLRAAATFYVEVFRNTPLTVVFFFLALRHRRDRPAVPDSASSPPSPRCRCTRRRSSPRRCARASTRCRPGQAEAARALGLDFRPDAEPASCSRRRSGPSSRRWATCGSRWPRTPRSPPASRVTELAAALVRLSNQNADELLAVFLAIVAALPGHHPAVGLADRRHRATDGDPAMTTSTVLFDVPGPRGRRRQRIGTFVGRPGGAGADRPGAVAAGLERAARPGALGGAVRPEQRRAPGVRQRPGQHAEGGRRRHGARRPCWARCSPSGGCPTTAGCGCRSPRSIEFFRAVPLLILILFCLLYLPTVGFGSARSARSPSA